MKGKIMNTINRSVVLPFAILAMWATNGASSALAEQSAQPAFPSAAEATQNLFQAVQSNNEQAIARILGGPTELTSSSDDVQDKLDRQLFVQKYQEMHRVGRETNESVTLYIGAENWPFPIPLVEKNGQWRFDSDTGMKEALFRRIGENEFAAIATCHEFVAAEKQYRAQPHTAVLADISPASLVAKAEGESSGDDPVLLNGYYFHVLAGRPNVPGGFALIAYPAQYRSSGVMTFIVTGKDVVYEQDLGADTPTLARAMTAFHKDSTWHIADK
jgi:hypothetical protein